jgi:subtilisin family serine protease
MSRQMRDGFRKMLLLVIAIPLLAVAAAAQQGTGDKIEVKTLSDLPVHTYPLEGSVSELLGSQTQFAALARQLRANIEADLKAFDIQDRPTLQKMHQTLLLLDLLEGNEAGVVRNVEIVRKLEDKEAVRLTTGLMSEAVLAARRAADPAQDLAAYRAAFKQRFGELVFALPWDVVQDRIQQSKGMTEILSENLILGMVQGQLDPTVAKTGELSADLADQVVRLRAALTTNMPLREDIVAVYGEMIDGHRIEKENIWLARDERLDPRRQAEPVLIGIWDSGVDCAVFPEIVYVNPKEKLDGRDDDGNGFIDDLHGIGFDVNGRQTSDLLFPVGQHQAHVAQAMNHMKGFMDLQSGIESPEATELRGYFGSLEPEQVGGFIEDLGLCALYAHGTHVAGIAVNGNPFARLLVARITFDYHQIPQPMTIEIAQRHAESYHATTRYFREHGVRVVNMSWGWTYREIESGLEANGIGETAEERAGLAREILNILSRGLEGAIADTPEILYVCAAGNEDSDVEFDVFIPANFVLPNLLVVGAVDQAGRRTDFTSMGQNVIVYSNGFEVDSSVPGGARMQMSGTSMASPNVTNLAAKLLALKSDLEPAAVIELIKKGSDRLEDQQDLLLINPKATVALLGNP